MRETNEASKTQLEQRHLDIRTVIETLVRKPLFQRFKYLQVLIIIMIVMHLIYLLIFQFEKTMSDATYGFNFIRLLALPILLLNILFSIGILLIDKKDQRGGERLNKTGFNLILVHLKLVFVVLILIGLPFVAFLIQIPGFFAVLILIATIFIYVGLMSLYYLFYKHAQTFLFHLSSHVRIHASEHEKEIPRPRSLKPFLFALIGFKIFDLFMLLFTTPKDQPSGLFFELFMGRTIAPTTVMLKILEITSAVFLYVLMKHLENELKPYEHKYSIIQHIRKTKT